MLLALGASGVVVFACGGGNKESTPPSTGSASATPSAPSSSAAATPTDTATATASASATPPTPATPFTIVAMKATMTSKGKQHTLELKADGSVLADGKPSGKITNAELDDTGGQTLAYVTGDNTIKVSGQTSSSTAKFDDKDAITVDGNTIISVADDGNVTLVGPDGKPDKSGKMKFAGFKPAGRRVAAFLVFGMLIPKMATVTTIGTASAVTPATTPPKK